MANEYPNAVEMEKRILSAMLLREGDAIPKITALLGEGEDLYRESHRMIYKAIVGLYGSGSTVDILLLEEELKRRGELDKVGRAYLFSLTELEYTTARIENYARKIHDCAVKRKLIDYAREILGSVQDSKKTATDILAEAESNLLTFRRNREREGFEQIKSICQNTVRRIEELSKKPNTTGGVTTGYLDLDKATNGWQKSDLMLLAARPSMGKTALALNMGLAAAKLGATVGIFSLEMSKMQLGTRLLSLESGINSQKLNTGSLSREELNDMVSAYERLGKLPMYIDDTAGLSLVAMRSRARELKREAGLDLIILDYIQLMGGTTRNENRQQEIAEISRGLKSFAREQNIPILALSQLSRQVEMRAEKKPQLSDLRESGSLEQDADLVMFLYRDEYYNRDDAEKQNLAEVIIAKNRNGPTTSVMLQFTKETMTFNNFTRQA